MEYEIPIGALLSIICMCVLNNLLSVRVLPFIYFSSAIAIGKAINSAPS